VSQAVTDQIWNRAAQGGGDSPGCGDRALASLLLLHGLSMNGGVHHAIECLSPDEVANAIEGFAYFGFDDMTVWLNAASSDPVLKEWTDETEIAALYRYAELIPDDDCLVTRFEAVYQERTSEFAPLENSHS
jgi:hypothetical protein